MTDDDISAESQLGVHAPTAVDAVGLNMDLGDHIDQHRVPDRAFRRRAFAVLVEPGLRDLEDLERHLDRHPFRGRTTRAAGVKGLTMHSLRHYFASGLMADGCDVVTVQRALGHKSAAVTLNTYSHLWPTAEDRTRQASGRMAAEALTFARADLVRTDLFESAEPVLSRRGLPPGPWRTIDLCLGSCCSQQSASWDTSTRRVHLDFDVIEYDVPCRQG